MKFLRDFLVLGSGIVSALYLLNPTAGVDFIPDIIPIIGNLDEAAATALLINCLAYFGVDIGHFLKRKKPEDKPGAPKTHDIEVTKE